MSKFEVNKMMFLQVVTLNVLLASIGNIKEIKGCDSRSRQDKEQKILKNL